MKRKGIGFGVFLLTIGVIWVLVNFGIINWSIIDSLVDLWPLFLVVIGINIVAGNREAVKIVTWLLFLAVIVTYGYVNGSRFKPGTLEKENGMYIEKPAETVRGDLRLSLGGLNLDIGSGSSYLLEGAVTNPVIKHSVNYDDGKKTARIDVRQSERQIFVKGLRNRRGYSCSFNLNTDVVWDINAKLGAVNGTIDLSNIKVENLDTDIGAGNLDIVFGTAHDTMNVKMNAGASKLELVIPEASGVKLKVNGLLNSTDISSLNWDMEDGYYISQNYSEAGNKINIDLTMGVGSLSIKMKK